MLLRDRNFLTNTNLPNELGSMRISSNSKILSIEEEFLSSSRKHKPLITKHSSNSIEIHNMVLPALR